MPNLAYRVTVNSPCSGDQLVNKIATTHYTGANGDFTYAVLTRSPSDPQWQFVIYDYSGPGPCSPSKLFTQVTPDADDPTGAYEGANSTEEAVVSDWP